MNTISSSDHKHVDFSPSVEECNLLRVILERIESNDKALISLRNKVKRYYYGNFVFFDENIASTLAYCSPYTLSNIERRLHYNVSIPELNVNLQNYQGGLHFYLSSEDDFKDNK